MKNDSFKHLKIFYKPNLKCFFCFHWILQVPKVTNQMDRKLLLITNRTRSLCNQILV